MNKFVIHGCTVELTMPTMAAVDEFDSRTARISLMANECIEDVKVFLPEEGQIGTLVQPGKRTLTIKRLLVRKLLGDMLPVSDGDKVALFTVEDLPEPDAIVAVD